MVLSECILRHLRLILGWCQSPTLDTNHRSRVGFKSFTGISSCLHGLCVDLPLPCWSVGLLILFAISADHNNALGRPTSPTLLMAKKKLQNNVKQLPTKTEKACQMLPTKTENSRLFNRQPASNDNTDDACPNIM